MNRVAIIGAGEFGKQVLQIASTQKKYVPVGFFDDFYQEEKFRDIDVLGKIDDVETMYRQDKFDYLFISIGYNHLGFKQELTERFSSIPFATIIHPTVTIEDSAEIAEGVLIYANAYIGPGVKLSKGCVVNVYTYLPHDNLIKECTFLSGGIDMGGKVDVGERSFVGIGVTVTDNINICDDVFVGAGTVVIKDIDEPGTYVGCPARKIK